MIEPSVNPGKGRLLQWFTLAVALTILTIGWLSWTAFRGYRFVTGQLPVLNRMDELRGQILVFDEVLTMSARMAAATGDLQWEARYRRFDPQLVQALQEALRLAPAAAQSQAAAQTDAANTKLVAMENRAFELVRQGQRAAAQHLLASAEYEAQKKVYAAGMTELNGLLRQTIDSVRAQREVQVRWSVVLTALAAPLLSLVWWCVLRAERRWQTALVRSHEQMGRQAKELEEFTRTLDEKVSERTKQLKKSEWAMLNMMEDAVRNGEKAQQAFENLKREMAERKNAEEALRESEERYRKLVELSPDAICVRFQDKLVLANRAAVALFGAATANELHGRNFLELVHPDSRALVEGRMRQLQESNANLPVVEEKLRRLDGSSLDTEVTTAPFTFQGQPSALVVIRDITEKKALNEKMLRHQRLESIGTLAGGIAHDLNNVLAPILMSIEILRLKYPEPDAGRILATIQSSAQRGADMVKQVLAFARGVQGERVPLQISHLIKEIAKILKQTLPKAIQILTSVPQELWVLTGDATQLHQVLMNLCVNARDAMPGGGTLTLGAKNFLIDDNYAGMNPEAKAGPYLVVTVTDTGTGIPPEVRDRIFEPFFTTKPLDKGTGLGLATARGIIKSHGGFVTVSSEVGNGTEFKVYLPAQKSEATKRVEAEQHALPMGKGELILVADDEAAILNMAKQTLEMFGYQVLTAGDGAQATVVCAQNQGKIKVLVTDMMMPIMDGAATIHAVRTIDSTIKIIATSGLGSEVKATDPLKLQVDVFLQKPYTAETLLRTVQQVLQEK